MTTTVLKQLCIGFVERAKACDLKGKKRDAALIDYMCGAYQALTLAGRADDANHVGTMLAMVFTVRGFSECERIANAQD